MNPEISRAFYLSKAHGINKIVKPRYVGKWLHKSHCNTPITFNRLFRVTKYHESRRCIHCYCAGHIYIIGLAGLIIPLPFKAFWLLRFYVLTTNKITMTWYPTKLHYPDTEQTSPCPLLVGQSSRSDKYHFWKSLVWVSYGLNPWPPTRELNQTLPDSVISSGRSWVEAEYELNYEHMDLNLARKCL